MTFKLIYLNVLNLFDSPFFAVAQEGYTLTALAASEHVAALLSDGNSGYTAAEITAIIQEASIAFLADPQNLVNTGNYSFNERRERQFPDFAESGVTPNERFIEYLKSAYRLDGTDLPSYIDGVATIDLTPAPPSSE